MRKNIYDIAIIGGGASGLMLAARLDLNGLRRTEGTQPGPDGIKDISAEPARGIILEGSSKPGTKLLMSGGGRCNITHGGSVKEFIYAYGDAGPSLRRCLYRHNNLEFAAWLASRGLELADEDGRPVDPSSSLEGVGRIFPASMKAQDVLDLFLDEAEKNGWELSCDSVVSGLAKAEQSTGLSAGSAVPGSEDGMPDLPDGTEDPWRIELASGKALHARRLVIASGGITYPETGSDGSMFGILKSLGISITEPRPALSPVYVYDYPYAELSGISVPDVSVTTFSEDAACTCKGSSARTRGDLLFTHKGFSGPVILNISRYAEAGQKIRIRYNKEFEELPRRMQRILEDRSRGPSGDVKSTVLASLLDRDDFVVSGTDKRGMVTAGGIALKDMDLKTMRIAADLYAVGEAIDADGITGGYNLQLCWSTASAAAEDISAKEKL